MIEMEPCMIGSDLHTNKQRWREMLAHMAREGVYLEADEGMIYCKGLWIGAEIYASGRYSSIDEIYDIFLQWREDKIRAETTAEQVELLKEFNERHQFHRKQQEAKNED